MINEPSRVVAEGDSLFHLPSLSEFTPPAILFGGTPFEVNRVQLIRLFVVVVVLGATYLIASRSKLVPGRIQSVFELLIEFVQNSIVNATMGEEKGRKYAPMLITIFLFVLTMNLAGIFPLTLLAGTSVVGLPLVIALWTFVTYVVAGVKTHGFAGYLKHETMPPGIPKLIYLVLAPIEFLQVVFIRWGSLTIRLLANMIAGHMMLVVFVSMAHGLLFAGNWLVAVSPFAGALAVGIYGFEIFVGALQAFVFTILSAVYINMATSEEH